MGGWVPGDSVTPGEEPPGEEPAGEESPASKRSWPDRQRTGILTAGVLIFAVVATAVAVPLVRHRLRYGTEYDASDHTVRVSAGDRFSLLVSENTSVGDSWELRQRPEAAVVRFVRDEARGRLLDRFRAPSDGGPSKTRYFTFEATAPGTVTIKLYNCFRGCRKPADLWVRSWDVTVR